MRFIKKLFHWLFPLEPVRNFGSVTINDARRYAFICDDRHRLS